MPDHLIRSSPKWDSPLLALYLFVRLSCQTGVLAYPEALYVAHFSHKIIEDSLYSPWDTYPHCQIFHSLIWGIIESISHVYPHKALYFMGELGKLPVWRYLAETLLGTLVFQAAPPRWQGSPPRQPQITCIHVTTPWSSARMDIQLLQPYHYNQRLLSGVLPQLPQPLLAVHELYLNVPFNNSSHGDLLCIVLFITITNHC